MPNIRQRRWRAYQSSKELLTPYLWASIITGLPPEKALPVSHQVLPVNPIFKWAKEKLRFLRGHGLGKFVKRRWVDRRDLSVPTIFDKVKSVVIDFPAYNWHMDFEIFCKYPYSKVIGDKKKSEILFSTVQKHDRLKIEMVIKLLKKDSPWSMLAVWTQSTDVVNHLFWKDKTKILKTYTLADSWAKRIRERLPDNCCLIIMSDHGGVDGVHRDKGFVSINKDFELPDELTQFHDFFLSLVKDKLKSETDFNPFFFEDPLSNQPLCPTSKKTGSFKGLWFFDPNKIEHCGR